MAEGRIGFACRWTRTALAGLNLRELEHWRRRLHARGLIGVGRDGVGYGNLSRRLGRTPEFLITGHATGGLATLDARHYTRVVEYDIDRSALTCVGLVSPSCEALTHAAVYAASPVTGGVIHVHSRELWHALRDRVPTTPARARAGTPGLARAIGELLAGHSGRAGVVVLGGHRDGIITVGPDLAAAGESLLAQLAG